MARSGPTSAGSGTRPPNSSRRNLIALLPYLTELKLYDNTAPGAPADGELPQPMLVLHLKAGKIIDACGASDVPGWAKPLVQAVIRRLDG